LLNCPEYKETKIYHYCNSEYDKKANAAFLMGAYQVLCLSRSAIEAWKPFEGEEFVDYRDSLKGPCSYKCTIYDCLEGLEWAQKLGWYNKLTFNLHEYNYYSSVEHGDMNWIIPGKLLAFSAPIDEEKAADNLGFDPEFYVPIFKKLGVTAVVRLTTKDYDRDVTIINLHRNSLITELNTMKCISLMVVVLQKYLYN